MEKMCIRDSIDSFKRNLRGQLNNISIQEKDGNSEIPDSTTLTSAALLDVDGEMCIRDRIETESFWLITNWRIL